ncbi:MAG: cytochrome c [Proteobacteria bacterium]|nr:cytochrome c [Pseudomonadota bacterium]
MTIRTVAGVLLGACALAWPLAHASAGAPPAPALRSVSVQLPVSKRMFPGGAEAAPANANCLTCHSAGMVLNQPSLSKATWEAEVKKMIAVYKAPIAEKDIAPIAAYLAATKGTD